MASSSQKPRRSTPRPRVMPDVVASLGRDIVGGHYPSGSILPTEPDLCGRYGVSRTVIREALKVLAAKGLVTTRPRVGTTVQASENWNIIDAQVIEWHGPQGLDDHLLAAILETRRAIEPIVAELAATRATLHEIADLETAWRGMAEAGDDVESFTRADIAFHRVLFATSHNPVFRQIGLLIDSALRSVMTISSTNAADHRAEAVRRHHDLVEALRLRDAAAARRAANDILDLAQRDLSNAGRKATNQMDRT